MSSEVNVSVWSEVDVPLWGGIWDTSVISTAVEVAAAAAAAAVAEAVAVVVSSSEISVWNSNYEHQR